MVEINKDVQFLNFLENGEFYVMYLDPAGVVQKLYATSCVDLIDFMREHIQYESGDGVNITICTKEMSNAVICNHDGQIFVIKDS